MEQDKTICGQCSKLITGSSIGHGDWVQCFDCYCEEYEYTHGNNDEDESYADHYCRTSCSCCSNNDYEQWDEEE